MTGTKMRISGSGVAHNGLRAINERSARLQRELNSATDAISCLHDALLAVARGRISPEEVREFFWTDNLDLARYIGGVIKFDEVK